jgi:hypothetical protein
MEPQFSFVVFADCHVTGEGARADTLRTIVDWINTEAATRQIELVLVLGDIGWDAGITIARGILDQLTVPYVPLTGDNEIHNGVEADFESTFGPQLTYLETVLDNWQAAPWPVWNPDAEEDSWLQNFSFDHRGVHFIGVDWCDRGEEGLTGEFGTLHDFEGGSWPWLESDLAGHEMGEANSVLMASHIPMHNGAFDVAEMSAIKELVDPYKDNVYANLAGHVHLSYELTVADVYEVYVTAATWYDDLINLRVVSVAGNGESFAYTHELVVVPE